MAQATGTYNRATVITKSDTVNFDGSTYSASPSTIFEDGSLAPFTVTAGTRLDLKCIRVNSTNTTATLMNALYQV